MEIETTTERPKEIERKREVTKKQKLMRRAQSADARKSRVAFIGEGGEGGKRAGKV
jgi:hypothetical protein